MLRNISCKLTISIFRHDRSLFQNIINGQHKIDAIFPTPLIRLQVGQISNVDLPLYLPFLYVRFPEREMYPVSY